MERPRDSHKGEDSDDGHRDEQLDGDDGVNLEHRQWWGARSPPCTPGLSPGSSRALRPRSPKDLTTLALAPLSELGRSLLPHSEGSTLTPLLLGSLPQLQLGREAAPSKGSDTVHAPTRADPHPPLPPVLSPSLPSTWPPLALTALPLPPASPHSQVQHPRLQRLSLTLVRFCPP